MTVASCEALHALSGLIWEDQEGVAVQSSLSGKQLCVEETLEGVISAEPHTRDSTSNVKHHFCSCMRKW